MSMKSFSFDQEKDVVGTIKLKNLTLKEGKNKVATSDSGVTLWATVVGSQIVYWTSVDKDNNPLDTFAYYKAELHHQISQPSGEREITKEEAKDRESSQRECFIVCTASIPQQCWFVCQPIVLEA